MIKYELPFTEVSLPDESLKLSLALTIDELRPFLNEDSPNGNRQKFDEFLQK